MTSHLKLLWWPIMDMC